MQEFDYEKFYDLVWIQWTAEYLTDKDFIDFLVKTRNSL